MWQHPGQVTEQSQLLHISTYLARFEKAAARTRNRGACRVDLSAWRAEASQAAVFCHLMGLIEARTSITAESVDQKFSQFRDGHP